MRSIQLALAACTISLAVEISLQKDVAVQLLLQHDKALRDWYRQEDERSYYSFKKEVVRTEPIGGYKSLYFGAASRAKVGLVGSATSAAVGADATAVVGADATAVVGAGATAAVGVGTSLVSHSQKSEKEDSPATPKTLDIVDSKPTMKEGSSEHSPLPEKYDGLEISDLPVELGESRKTGDIAHANGQAAEERKIDKPHEDRDDNRRFNAEIRQLPNRQHMEITRSVRGL